MMTGQHTKGPWEIDKDPPHIPDGIKRKFIQATHCKYISDGEEVVGTKDICHVHTNVFRMVPGEWEANAHLIAAAPELLEVLEMCLNSQARNGYIDSDTYEKARAAIAKAETVETDT